MSFDVYFPFKNKQGVWCPGVRPVRMTWAMLKQLTQSQDIRDKVVQVRSGNKEKKRELPCVCWTGNCTSDYRRAESMEPTQFVMVDIDHCKDCEAALKELLPAIKADADLEYCVAVVHKTPSLGLRIVFRAIEDYASLTEHMVWLKDKLGLDKYGDFDGAVKDLSRLSFLVGYDDWVYVNERILMDEVQFEHFPVQKGAVGTTTAKAENTKINFEEENLGSIAFSEEEKEKYDAAEYRGTPMRLIVDKYVEVFGTPGSGEIHNYYNEMVKNFRCIMDNDKKWLLYALPRFGHGIDECWSQIVSITRVNTLSRLPKPFYFFLKEHGFYEPRGASNDSMKNYMLSEEEIERDEPPYLPPVFRELIGTCPKDFVLPCIDALLPILGTLTSYLQSTYPYDNRTHTTSFFTVIYAPPGTGKGFVERFMDILFEDLKIRDFISSQRENIYLRVLQKRGANDRVPDQPHVSLRIIPAKNSEAELLQKMSDNHGYHMFTYSAEMDSWAKGVRAAGGNKDDMIRIAWDNGEYGQQFKAFNTFKGIVRLYWNVLITGTLNQVENYFKDVENGLVTRCSFCSIDNQEFVAAPVWRPLSKRSLDVLRAFCKRCDERTYETPCSVNIADVMDCAEGDFDGKIDWQFKFKERRTVDMSWIMPMLDNFQEEQIKKAALDIDRARDVFRRRVGVRGFRLGLLCYGLWDRPRQADLEKCLPFIRWWMEHDIEQMMKLWADRYNSISDGAVIQTQRKVYTELKDSFTRSDVFDICMKQGIKTPVRRILHDWRRLGYVEKIDKDNYKKKR